MINECTCGGKRAKAGDPILLKKDSGPSLNVDMGCISWFGPGAVTAVNGNINAIKYQNILEDNLWPVIVQHFPQGGIFFKMIMLQSTVKIDCRLQNLKIITRHSPGLPNHQISI